jgi:hypothetical protein
MAILNVIGAPAHPAHARSGRGSESLASGAGCSGRRIFMPGLKFIAAMLLKRKFGKCAKCPLLSNLVTIYQYTAVF